MAIAGNTSMKGSIVEFRTRDGVLLDGFLATPKKMAKRGVLFIHGLGGSFFRSRMIKDMAAEMPKRGIAFLSIEQRGSYGAALFSRIQRGKRRRMLAGGGFEKFKDCIHDIEGGIRALSREGVREIFIAGHSTGCQKAAYYQSKKKDRKVKGIILIAPADDYNSARMEGKRFDMMYRYARRRYKKEPDAMMPYRMGYSIESPSRFMSRVDSHFIESRIFNYELKRLREFNSIKVPILAVFGSREKYVPRAVEECLGILRDNSSTGKFIGMVIKGADHGFKGKGIVLAEAVAGWIESGK